MYTTTTAAAPFGAPMATSTYYPSAAAAAPFAAATTTPVYTTTTTMDPMAALNYQVIPYQPPSTGYAVYDPTPMGYAGPLVALPEAGPMVAQAPTLANNWLYTREDEHYPKHEEESRVAPLRKVMYSGTLPRAMLSEAYLCGHLCHQATIQTAVVPGETLQLNSSTGRTTLLSVVQASMETPDLAWRLLTDGYSSYLVFRGSAEYQYPAYDSRVAILHDVLPKVSLKVHNLLLHQVVPQLKAILEALDSQPHTRRVVLAGHGNGGAYAVLCFLLLLRAGYARRQVVVYTFGAPLCMNGSLKPDRPLPREITGSLFHFVNDDDLVPCLLGNKDLHTVDHLLAMDPVNENPYKTGRHSVRDLLSYQPIGRFFHFTSQRTMVDVPTDRVKFFLNVNRGSSNLAVRLRHHQVESYVDKLRALVTDN